MASVNLIEDGAPEVMDALVERGIGIEAGIWSLDDVGRLAAAGHEHDLVRILVEIVNPAPDPAGEALAIDQALDELTTNCPRLHHGEGDATWPVLRHGQHLGRDVRIGFADTLMLPDGTLAPSNADLVHAALTHEQ